MALLIAAFVAGALFGAAGFAHGARPVIQEALAARLQRDRVREERGRWS